MTTLKVLLPLLLLGSPLAIAGHALIPFPKEIKEDSGNFEWKVGTAIRATPASESSVALLREYFGPLVGELSGEGSVVFEEDARLQGEAYELEIRQQEVILRASGPRGWCPAIQTLRQLLLPPEKLAARPTAALSLPCVRIKDEPRFGWRGIMLDSTLHFYPKGDVLKFIDTMALYKFNVFHWHLTDDGGWRLQIRKYPKLTEVGAWREEKEGRYGGYYTQDDAREIVKYAQARGITVVPEIDMPAHCMAALAAYPELSVKGGPYKVQGKMESPSDVMDVTKEEVYTFIDEVLGEVVEIFPSPFIHIGGDEVDQRYWKADAEVQAFMQANGLRNEDALQSHFIRRVEKIVSNKCRRMIGWEEIQYGGLAPGAAVMAWRKDGAYGLEATKTGADVVMTPEHPCYFNLSDQNPLERVYSFEPVPTDMPASQAKHVIGMQGCNWTPHKPAIADVEGQTYPRALAIAERAWSDAGKRDYEDFEKRVKVQLKCLEALGVRHEEVK